MLKWAHQGGKGSETEDMNRMSFQVSGKTKKSFKTTPPPPNATKPPPAPGPTPAQSSNGSTKSNGAPPSPAISHTSTGSGEIPRGPGQRSLEITLPSGNTVTATVDDKLQMMDLVVMIAAKNKLNPTGHVIIPSAASRTDISQFKASQRIGELDTTKLQIVPKLSRGEIQSLKGSEKRKAAQFEQTIRLTVLSGKNHKALLRVNPEKPIQDFLPQVYEELAVVEANDPRLRLVKKPDEDIDYSKSLNYYEVNELLLVDLNPPPPPQEPEPAPIEKKKKSMFGRKSKKKGEVTLEPTSEPATKPAAVAPQKETVVESAQAVAAHAPAVKQASIESNDSVPGENTLKKRRPAPPPPSAAKKEPSSQGSQSPKTTLERASHAVSKKRRAPAPPPAGGAPLPPAVPLPSAAAPDVTVNGDASPAMSDQERRITFGNAEVMESGSESASSVTPSPAETPSSTLERRKEGGDATEIQPQEVDVNLAELDAVLDDSNLPSDPSSVAPDPPNHDATDGGPAQGAVPVPLTPPPVFVPPPPPNEPPSPGEPQEDVGRLIEEGILMLARGGGEGPDTISECSSDPEPSLNASATSSLIQSMEAAFEEAIAVGTESLTEDLGAEEAISVSEVSVGSNDQSQVPAAEDPESGEKIKVDATLTVGESAEEEEGEEEKEVEEDQEVVEAEETVVVQSERPTEEDVEVLCQPQQLTAPTNTMSSSEHNTADTNKPDLLTGTNVSLVAAVVEPLRPVAKPRNFSQILVEGKQQNDRGGWDTVSDANRHTGGHHVHSGNVPQDSNSAKPPVPRPRMGRISSEPELGVGGSDGKGAKLTKQLSADQQPGLYRKRKAPKRPPPIQDNAALSALQSAFLQALSQQSKNASANKVSTAPAMKLRPSRPPPLPPSFRKERSSSTTESRSGQAPPKHLAPRSASESELKLATAGVLAPTQQPGKGHGGVGNDARPAVPPRRKKKSSSDIDGKGRLQDDKSDVSKNKLPSSETLKDSQAAGRSAVPPVPAARMRKQNSADAKIDAVRPDSKASIDAERTVKSQNCPKGDIATVPKKSNQIQVRAEIVAPPARVQEQNALPPVDGNIMAAQNSSGSIIPMQKTSSVAREASTKPGPAQSDSNPSSENLEDVLRRRLRGLHRSVRLEESFDASMSNDDVFLDDSFGDASSGPNARSSDHLSSTHDSTDVQPPAASGQPPQEAVEGATSKRVPSGLEGGEPEPVVLVDSVTSPTSVSPVLPEKVKETSDILDKRAALTRMMKLSLDDDSNETTSYSPTPQGEESDSVLEEKSLTALAAPVSRQSLDDAVSESKAEDVVQDTAEEMEEKVEDLAEDVAQETREKEAEEVDDKDVEMSKDAKEEEKVVTEKEQKVEEKPDDAEIKDGDGEKEEDQKQENKEDVSVDKEQETASETVKVEPGQPSMQQLTEQYKQLQQQMAMLQQQLMANPSAAHMAANPGMTYQMQQMQQQQMQHQIMLQQQLLLQQQQQQQVMMPPQAPYMMMQQPAGGVLMSPPQMVYTPMGMQPMPVYGQMTPPQAISTPVEQASASPVVAPPVVAPEKSAEDSGKSGSDEADAPLKEDSPKVDQMVEAIPEDTPTKPQTSAQAAASGRRNVFADILKKKNNPKASYVLSAQREAQRQRSDSNSSLNSSSSSSKDDSVSGSMSTSLSTSKTDSRTETTAPPPEARRQESIELVTNGLSPTLPTPPETPEASPIRDDATPTTPPKPDSPVSPTSPHNSSNDESNNNTSKSMTVDTDVQPTVPVQNPKHDPVLPLPTDNNAKKAPPPIRPKPQVGPRPYRPASMYARIGEGAPDSQVETSKFSAHARKVADLRSMFMLGK